MRSDQETENIKTRDRSKAYWIGAVIFLVAMGLLWSLDSSLVYLTFGGAVFCLFMAFWSRSIVKPQHQNTSFTQHTRSAAAGASKNILLSDIKEIFKSKTTFQSRRPKPSEFDAQKRTKTIILVAFITLFLVAFIVPIILTESVSSSPDASEYYYQGEQFRTAGQYDSAIRYYQLALQEDPESNEALQSYGDLLIANEKYDDALRIYNAALEANPDHEFASYSKALVHYYQKNYRVSLQQTLRLLEKSPAYYDAMVLAGGDYYMQNRYDSALFWYEEAYGNGVRSASLCNVLAYLYDQKGNTEKAVPLYQEALSYDSALVDIYQRLGELFPGSDGEEYRKLWRELKSQGY